ncbi:hypothetical protein QFC24_000701 [Naganishia onofrii]|uniref:Uncharacterized protein n=1 Tax=Naganishia onofrii TaxID=1851511 RepID=A0ACC2XUY5_9TREE|nr:hypothetical protein QFC24_000701 [Naganishia onofrii]
MPRPSPSSAETPSIAQAQRTIAYLSEQVQHSQISFRAVMANATQLTRQLDDLEKDKAELERQVREWKGKHKRLQGQLTIATHDDTEMLDPTLVDADFFGSEEQSQSKFVDKLRAYVMSITKSDALIRRRKANGRNLYIEHKTKQFKDKGINSNDTEDDDLDPIALQNEVGLTLTKRLDRKWARKTPVQKAKWLEDNAGELDSVTAKKRKVDEMTDTKKKNAIKKAFNAICQEVRYQSEVPSKD